MTDLIFSCPQCGEEVEELVEGYCWECRDERQRELDAHNIYHDRWAGMSDFERWQEIKRAAQ